MFLDLLFGESIIISEQREYLAEGIYWVPLDVPNNDAIMELINSKPNGMFSLLEASCNMPNGTLSWRNGNAAHEFRGFVL